jgi:hypothetical protein
MLPQGLPAPVRTRVFGIYNTVATLAGSLGALAAAGPALLLPHASAGVRLPADQRLFLVFVPIGLAGALLAGSLSRRVEVRVDGQGSGPPAAPRAPLGRSRGRVLRLSGLFALDAFGGGFVIQSFIAYWLRVRFDASVELLGVVFFAVGLLQAGSFLAATRLAERIGLLATMVFTHLPSNLLLVAIPLAPNLPVAVGLLLGRFALSQMDVAGRDRLGGGDLHPGPGRVHRGAGPRGAARSGRCPSGRPGRPHGGRPDPADPAGDERQRPADDLGLHPRVHGAVRDPPALRPTGHPDRPGLDLGRCSATSRPSGPTWSRSATPPCCAPSWRWSASTTTASSCTPGSAMSPLTTSTRAVVRRSARPAKPDSSRPDCSGSPAIAPITSPTRPPPRARPVRGARRCWLIDPGSVSRTQKRVTITPNPPAVTGPRPPHEKPRLTGDSLDLPNSDNSGPLLTIPDLEPRC